MISTIKNLPNPTLLLVFLSSIIQPINSEAIAIAVPDNFASKAQFIKNQQAIQLAGLSIKEDAAPAIKASSPNISKPLGRQDLALLRKITRSGLYQFPDGSEFVEFHLNRTQKSIVFVNGFESSALPINVLSVDAKTGLINLKSKDGMTWILKSQSGVIKQILIEDKSYTLQQAKIDPRRSYENTIMPDVMQKVREHEKAINRLNEEFIKKLNRAQ
jgi:hypothetical protein